MLSRALCVIAAIVVPAGFAGGALAAQQQRLDDAYPDVAPSIADGSAQRDLDAARARWHTSSPRSYTYRGRLSCYCTVESVRPHTFVVRNRKPMHPAKDAKRFATAARLFALVQGEIDDKVDGLNVRYRKNGLLKQLDVDQRSNGADDEYSYYVDRFSSP
jgi:hypothetical protein